MFTCLIGTDCDLTKTVGACDADQRKKIVQMDCDSGQRCAYFTETDCGADQIRKVDRTDYADY